MRLAFLSDVHGNPIALEAVLNDSPLKVGLINTGSLVTSLRSAMTQ